MIRTQIQLPDDVFARAKKVCETREISMAELARRGFEYMLSVYGEAGSGTEEWRPPTPRRLGWQGMTEEELKFEAQRTMTEHSLMLGSGR